MNESKILASLFRILFSLAKSAINFIYPPYCLICQFPLKESDRLICENCWQELPKIDENLDVFNEIGSRLADEIFFSEAISIWEFNPQVQTIIHHLKYQGFKVLANRIGIFMADRIKKMSLSINNTILIPVPLHKTRIRERGYNQSALLCQVIASETSFVYNEEILKRIRYTQSQTKLNTVERAKNVENAFKVFSSNEIKNKLIVLVDDIITTGSTMNACAKELMNKGASAVYLFSAVKA